MRFLHLDLEALAAWPDLKPAQLFIFGYIKRFCESRSKKVAQHRLPADDGAYTWIDYEEMLKALPHLNVRYRALQDHVEALVASALVERVVRSFQKSSKSYFRVSQAYYDREEKLDDESQAQKSASEGMQKTACVNAEGMQKIASDPSSLDRKRKTGEEEPPSLLTQMKEVAKGKGVSLSFLSERVKSMKDPAFGKCSPPTIPLVSFAQSVQQLQDERRATNGNILRAWTHFLDTTPEKARFFVEDYSKTCRAMNDADLEEHERIKRMERGGSRPVKYYRDGKLIEEGYSNIGATA
jgi:hypothetical protein